MLLKTAYQKILKPGLFLFHPDLVHKVFVKMGFTIGQNSLLRMGIAQMYGAPQGNWSKVVDGITYKSPVLLAAGFDYNGYLSTVLWELGFGGEEVGSVTAKKCLGNPPPNLGRLVKSKSIQVYKGLRNDGVEAIITRLKKTYRHKDFVMGISIAKTNDPECADESKAIADYVYSYKRLNEENIGSFYTINISCPNAFGGEDFASPEPLKKLLMAIKEIPSTKPVYFKMPINKPWEEFKLLLDVLQMGGAHGVVIGNLNKEYTEIDFSDELPSSEYRGGLSGKPCQKRSNELISKTKEYAPKLTIIGCGGVLTAEDALEKMKRGADLVQLISGMIFTGPHLINEINQLVSAQN